MTVQTDLYTALQSLVSGRLYPQVAPETVTLPFGVIYSIVSQVPTNALTGAPGLFNTRVQVDVFGRLYSDVQTLKASIRWAIGDRQRQQRDQPGAGCIPG